jgi:hypothetical protein
MFQNEVESLFADLRDWMMGSRDWFFLFAGNTFAFPCADRLASGSR